MIVLLQVSHPCSCKSVASTIPVLALHSVEPDCCRRVCWCIIHPTAWSSHSSMCTVTQVAIEPQPIEVTPVDPRVVICTSISFTRWHPDHTVLITLLGDEVQHLVQARSRAHWSVHVRCMGGVGDASHARTSRRPARARSNGHSTQVQSLRRTAAVWQAASNGV